jgi:dCMP deaminase
MKWNNRFLDLAKHVAGWSKDPSSAVGAVIVRPDRTICSVGFNGFPRGVEDSADRLYDRKYKLLFTVHAETNAILSAKEDLKGYSIYVWPYQPCAHCMANIIQSGITSVYCPENKIERWMESFVKGEEMAKEAEVSIIYL